jgi:hypothetical protein
MTDQQKLSTEDRDALWRQYADVHAKAQDTFDASVRTLAAGGVAVTVTIASAVVDTFDNWARLAVAAFLVALAANVSSYATAQKDMRTRLELVAASDPRGRDETAWTTRTYRLNVLAGVALVAGGALLAIFVAGAESPPPQGG